jgi:hypothetical protein
VRITWEPSSLPIIDEPLPDLAPLTRAKWVDERPVLERDEKRRSAGWFPNLVKSDSTCWLQIEPSMDGLASVLSARTACRDGRPPRITVWASAR